MVTLSKIYTRAGDGGTTRLGNNEAVSKTDLRVECCGEADELNCVLGLVLNYELSPAIANLVASVQNDLFDLGADLCLPDGDEGLRVSAQQVVRLEEAIDRINAELQPLNSFLLPGGSKAAALLHLARAVCRRAERRVWQLRERETVNENVSSYLNRLSDLLFVMARDSNDHGQGDVLWKPGRFREEDE